MKVAMAAGLAPAWLRTSAAPPSCDLGRISSRDLDLLSRSLVDGGRLVLPTTSDYQTVRLIWNQTEEALPMAIVRPRGVDDVRSALAWCGERGITPRIRSGGHSFAGYSTSASLVIDLRDLDGVTYETDGTVTLGAGGVLGEIGRRLYCERELTLPMGTCPTVGLSGLTMCGGIGFHMRSHGLTIDRLRSATVVLADGSVVETDESREPDLFWALRGGGMGSYGVVTDWNFDPIDALPQSQVTLTWAVTDFVEMMLAYQAWLPDLPPIGFTAAVLITATNGNVAARVTMIDEGDGSNLMDLANDLIALASAAPIAGPSLGQVPTPDCMAADEFSLDAGYRKSRYAMTPVDTDTLAIIRDEFIDRASQSDLAGTRAFLFMDGCGGKIDDVASSATAYAHRGALFSAQFGATWNGVADPAVAGPASEAWLDELYAAILPGFDGGCYPGYWDAKIVDWQNLYYGGNFGRLVQTKAAYDPDDFFRFQRSIPVDPRA